MSARRHGGAGGPAPASPPVPPWGLDGPRGRGHRGKLPPSLRTAPPAGGSLPPARGAPLSPVLAPDPRAPRRRYGLGRTSPEGHDSPSPRGCEPRISRLTGLIAPVGHEPRHSLSSALRAAALMVDPQRVQPTYPPHTMTECDGSGLQGRVSGAPSGRSSACTTSARCCRALAARVTAALWAVAARTAVA